MRGRPVRPDRAANVRGTFAPPQLSWNDGEQVTLELDHDRRLALAYVPAARRPAVEALWRLDAALASVLTTGREPMISRIRLAWWRESLEKLDTAPPAAEPLLQALAEHVLPAGISGAELAAMEESWGTLLSSGRLTREELETYAAKRGGLLFRYSARLLGLGDPAVEAAGASWALIDFARHSSVPEEAEAAVDLARQQAVPRRWPAPLRPLGMLSVLALRDAAGTSDGWESQGAPARMWRMLRHRLTGR